MESYFFRQGRSTPELPLRQSAQERYSFDETVRASHGGLLVAGYSAAQGLAAKISTVRDAARFPEASVKAGELYAAALIQELLRRVVTQYLEANDPQLLTRAYHALEADLGRSELQRTLARYVATFPPQVVAQGEVTPDVYLRGTTLAGTAGTISNRQVALEGLLLLHLANYNPALGRLSDLFDDSDLKETHYREVLTGLEDFFTGEPEVGPSGLKLFAALRAPIDASPSSLEGQLAHFRETWGEFLGTDFDDVLSELLLAGDTLREESKPTFGGGGPGPAQVIDPAGYAAQGTAGAFVPEEYERFSQDSSWMPSVVMLAKSTFVWLGQLSKQYGFEITRLDQIPDEELDELARRGFTGLWLIGLWERSKASKTIKNLRGNPDAVASAYSLYDYVIAEDLGGSGAFETLKARAWQRGIRMASDMVPNHVGVDGKWVVEHPEWFLQLEQPPYPSYTFDGPDLSQDPSVGIQLEDHYYDSSDAAVVFKRFDRGSGHTRYIYHGNDGTSMPWNDTAQIDYLNPEAREAVIQTILHVARLSPIIRFDAAMTLAKKHVQRLWYPEPGSGGAIASRAQYGAMPTPDFDRAIPHEFWREVVDRVAQEVPDTLLLAEAFWMMEGYFVRTLGMHRVYNSAFMHMFKNEDNAKYRLSIKNVLEYEPGILQRFVNFMNNPDEETAVAQFGKDDKYFGVAVMMATMPGLPMFGHGQVEGYTEKYGMEYRRAKLDEESDGWLIDRHHREIFPLLHRRWQFAAVENFQLYDLHTEHGVDENVFVYSNRSGDQASLVAFNNSFGRAQGWVRDAYPKVGEGSRPLLEALGLKAGPEDFVTFRDQVSGLSFLRRSRDLEGGMALELDAYKYQVFLDFREHHDHDGRYARLYDRIGAQGIYDVEAELNAAELEPVHAAFREVVSAEVIRTLRGERGQRQQEVLEQALPERLGTLLERSGSSREGARLFKTQLPHLIALPSLETLAPDAPQRGPIEQELSEKLSDAGSGTLYVALILDALERSGVNAKGLRLEPLIYDTFAGAGSADPARAQLLVTLLQRYGPTYDEGAAGLLERLTDDANARTYAKVTEDDTFDADAYHELTVRPLAYALLQNAEAETLEAYTQVTSDLSAAEAKSKGKWSALTGAVIVPAVTELEKPSKKIRKSPDAQHKVEAKSEKGETKKAEKVPAKKKVEKAKVQK